MILRFLFANCGWAPGVVTIRLTGCKGMKALNPWLEASGGSPRLIPGSVGRFYRGPRPEMGGIDGNLERNDVVALRACSQQGEGPILMLGEERNLHLFLDQPGDLSA